MRAFSATLVIFATILSVTVPAAKGQVSDNISLTEKAPSSLPEPSSSLVQTDIVGPAGSENFGQSVTSLPNGNFVVVDQYYDGPGPAADTGAVYLYSGSTGAIISTLTGNTAGDQIGTGITVLTNGNFVIYSPLWDFGPFADSGAVTWCSGVTGCSGAVTAANSVIGTLPNEYIGNGGITPLPNGDYVIGSGNWGLLNAGAVTHASGTGGTVGPISAANSLVGSSAGDSVGYPVIVIPSGNYVVASSYWDNGPATNAGAITWCSGSTGCQGAISPTNSLVGSTTGDRLGSGDVTALTGGNYVVASPDWDNGAAADAGAVTHCNGLTGSTGTVSAANSLVGTSANDSVGGGRVAVLANGNYVVPSPAWDNGAITNAGAVTFVNGSAGIIGPVSTLNSLVGSANNDVVGSDGVTPLNNGNYIVASPFWDNGATANVGAATGGSGVVGAVGIISTANSLIGSTANDQVTSGGVTALTNNNYVVNSPLWDNGAAADAGASTWGNGVTGTFGGVTPANSLVGTTTNDNVGLVKATALTNGNYVVDSAYWNNGVVLQVGAVTWGNGLGGTVGAVSAANSLVGTTVNDRVGNSPVIALTNGNYVVGSPYWNLLSLIDAGAVTWGNGVGGTVGPVSSANSIVGSYPNDQVGYDRVVPLTNGNYVFVSDQWDNGALVDAGAVTWGNGLGGTVGSITNLNSLVGTTAGDQLGNLGVFAVPNGNYVIKSSRWDNGSIPNAGVLTYGAGNGGTSFLIGSGNSIPGTITNSTFTWAFDPTNETIIVGRPTENRVSIYDPTYSAVADGNWSDASVWNYGTGSALHDYSISNGRSVVLDSIVTVRTLVISCTGALNGTGPANYVRGSTRRLFCSTGLYTFPVGTANGYSPVDVNVTAFTSSPVNFTVVPNEGNRSGMDPDQSVWRYWTLTAGTGLTADLTFHYRNVDVHGAEAGYGVYKFNGSTATAITPFTLNTAANTATVTGITSFSDWAIGNLAPSAAEVELSGRVLTATGQGVRNAVVSVTDRNGVSLSVRTGYFGHFNISELTAGMTYTVHVGSKRFTFPARTITLNDSVVDLELVALDQ